MRRPQSHERDTRAQQIFGHSLPSSWVARWENPDYGVDCIVEVFSHEESTGLRFGVQLKGTASPRISKDAICVSLPTRNLVDYVDNQRLPTFLVIANLTTEHCHYCFLQGYAQEQRLKLGWRNQRTVTIRVPLSNTLRDHGALEASVECADKAMAELRPGAIRPAIQAERKRLESLDPRFRIKVSASEEGQHVHLDAKEPVEVTLQISGRPEIVKKKMEDIVDRGLPVSFSDVNVATSGSRLFDDNVQELVGFHFSQSHEVSIRLEPEIEIKAGAARILPRSRSKRRPATRRLPPAPTTS